MSYVNTYETSACLKQIPFVLHTNILGRSPFLTIQLLPQFGFDHRTPKPVIFAIELSKPFKFDHWGCFDGWF